MKIKSISKFAAAHNLSRQTLEHRIKAGWKFGILDGEKVCTHQNIFRRWLMMKNWLSNKLLVVEFLNVAMITVVFAIVCCGESIIDWVLL